MKGKMNKGELISWNESKGYGFIRCDRTLNNIFLHISTLRNMSRKPKMGDLIYFETEQQKDGKTAAKNCRIEGVAANKQHTSKRKNQPKNNRFKIAIIKLLFIMAIVSLAYKYYIQYTSSTVEPIGVPQILSSSSSYNSAKTKQFSCDGRQHCSQMHSRAEAEYFIQHCPNTKMDGDRDGIPCENVSRF